MSDDALSVSGTPFPMAFPTVAMIVVDIVQRDLLRNTADKERLHVSSLPLAIKCKNQRCQQGGFQIESHIRNMVEQRKVASHFSMRCNGDEGPPAGRAKGGPCGRDAAFSILIAYKAG